MDTDETRMGGLQVTEAHPDKLLFRETTEAIIGAAFAVHGELGYGFLEKAYQRALQVELARAGHTAVLEHPITVSYRGAIVGEYFADLFVDGKVVVETKVAAEYNRLDEAQLINELRATGVRVGLLLNFGRREVQFRRLVY
jgi:GxxExxY protein